MNPAIWLFNLETYAAKNITGNDAANSQPMWHGSTLYFLSDRAGPVTLFAYDTRTRGVRQVVENHGLDLKSASAGPGAIVYEQFGSLHVLDLDSHADRPLEEFLHLVSERLSHKPSFECFGGHLELAPPLPRFWTIHWDTLGD